MNKNFNKKIILGIESSCDETGVALVEILNEKDNPRLINHALHSQINIHKEYGGVVPEIASRDHMYRVLPLIKKVLKESDLNLNQIDMIAFTKGPGLAGSLLVGSGIACSLALALNKPVIGIHHLEGHLLSVFLNKETEKRPNFPFIALLVSGGHTQLMLVKEVGNYELLGETLDDAAGEAFDKCAKLLNLSYPGGPELAKLAENSDFNSFKFPRPLLNSDNLDFSFAGLKTSVLNQVNKINNLEELNKQKNNLAASIQEAIIEVLIKKSLKSLKLNKISSLIIAGGVGANKKLREYLNKECLKNNIKTYYPDLKFCTDNGAMIAIAASLRIQKNIDKIEKESKNYSFEIKPRWDLTNI